MSKTSKLLLFAAGGLTGLVVLAALTSAWLLRTDAKSRVEASASRALEMDVKVNGRVSVGFLPGLHLALADVHASRRGADIASAGEVDLGVEFLPLLHKEVRIKNVALKGLRIALERDRDGKLNKQSASSFAAADCSLNVSGLQQSAGESAGFLRNLSFIAQLACGQVRTEDFTASDVKLSVDGKKGILAIDPITMRLFGGDGRGRIEADLSVPVPVYHVRYSLEKLRIEEYFKTLSPKPVGEGAMDFSANLSLQGETWDALTRSAAGEASLHGGNLKLQIGDLDKKLATYEKSQSFNLVDVGAFFFVGPLGVGITKGFDFARAFGGTDGTTTVRTLVSKWQVEHGIAHAIDVAMATQQNRVVLKGGLDFVTRRFDDVTVAMIDSEGCARVQQKIYGPFQQPEAEQPNVLGSFTGPMRKLFRQAKKLLGGHCEVFYAGSVVAPK
ncbi:MAG: AsmA family protein [Steroidobacteraceae bacterium]